MDSSTAAQSELVVAVKGDIEYKSEGSCVLKTDARGAVKKKPYEKPNLRVYGDIRMMTQAVASTRMHRDGKSAFGMNLKTS